MGRQARRFLAKVLTLGIVVCCCFTFIPRAGFAPNPLPGHAISRKAEPKREGESIRILTFAQAAREMKNLIDPSFKSPGSVSPGQRKATFNESRHVGHKLISGSEELPEMCSTTSNRPSYLNVKASVIVSLVHLGSDDAVFLLSRVLHQIPDVVTDDVIITAENVMKAKSKERLEDAVELCVRCRLFFFDGTIYEHRNQATKFSREDILIFVDGRVIPDEGWVEPLLFELNFDPGAVVSPQLQLWDREKSITSASVSRLELTWDMNVFRAPLTSVQKAAVKHGQVTAVNQTAVLKEVLGVRKNFFQQMGNFDIIPGTTGGEDVSLSMKVLNCGGEILMPVCSRVFMDVSPQREFLASPSHTEEEKKFHTRDYYSPSFREPKFNVTAYYDANSKLWLDNFSAKFFSASAHRQVNYKSMLKRRRSSTSRNANSLIFARYGKHANDLRSHLMTLECDVTNYRYVIARLEVDMLSPIPKTSFFGYIRSQDNLYAFGLQPNSSFFHASGPTSSAAVAKTALENNVVKMKHSNRKVEGQGSRNWLIFTRNSSLWVGPFAYVDAKLKYKRIWCVTVQQQRLSLELCQKQNPNQEFLYLNGVFRLAAGGGKFYLKWQRQEAGPVRTESVDPNLVLAPYDLGRSGDKSSIFVMDMELMQH